MAALTYFLVADNASFSQGLETVDPGAEASTSTGWTVAKVAATNYSEMAGVIKRASTTFAATALPNASPDLAILGDSMGTVAKLSGTFDAGVWAATFKVIAVTSGGDQDGNIRYRIWKSADASSFTELTSGAIVCGTVTNLATTASQTSAGSTASIGPFTLSNEWLFLQVAWQISGAGGANTRDVVLRKGTGITLVTPNFTAAAATKAPPFQSRTARNFLLRR